MKLLKNISIIYSFILIISFSNLLFASNNFNLIADQISISDEGDKIIAQGNVKIYSSNKVLNAEKIIYNNSNYLVQVYGPIKIIDDNNITITADYSLVSKDLKKIISSGVKALFEDYFKITSEEIKYNSGGKTKFKNSIGTSCKICSEDTSPPLWNIKSKLIVHDQDNKTLIFKNALLEIGGIPVFYTPYLKTPQPGVKRASGFLTPSIISSDINGYGIKQPYFIVLNNNSDLTVSLFKTNQTILFETEYRANLKNENINIKSTLEPNITNKKINGFINVKGEKIYPESFNLEYDFTLFDKKKSLISYDHEITDYVSNYLAINKFENNKKKTFETFYYQSLRTPVGEEPIIFPNYEEKNINNLFINNTILSNSFGILNLFNKNKRYTRIDHTSELRYNNIYKSGLIFENLGKVSNYIYNIREKDNLESNYFEIKPLISTTISYPLIKLNNSKNKEFLIPKLQVNYSPIKFSNSNSNQDSVEIDLDKTSLFSMNRFSGKDMQEQGFWVNSGIKYENKTINEKNFGTELGQIFRFNNINQFSETTGLNGKNSDFLISSFFDYSNFFSLKNTSLLTNNLKFRKSETSMNFNGKKNKISSSLIYETNNINHYEKKNLTEFFISLLSKINKNWKSNFDLRHDITNNQTISASTGLTFKNECVDFSVNIGKRFASSEKLPEDTRIELSFDLGGFGKRTNPSNSCSIM
ncbi:MAG: LPS-assembly protein LptD [Paracoccaceae bacterium]